MKSLIYVSMDQNSVCVGKNPDWDDLNPVKMTVLSVEHLLKKSEDQEYVDMLMNAFSLGRWLRDHCDCQRHYLFKNGIIEMTVGEMEVIYDGKKIALKGYLNHTQRESFLTIACASIIATGLSEMQTCIAQSYLMHHYAKKEEVKDDEKQGVYTH